MAQVWFKNNTASRKYSRDKVVEIFTAGLAYIKDDNNKVILLIEVWDYLEDQFGVSEKIIYSWRTITHKDDEEIQGLVHKIQRASEIRAVKDTEILRPNIQALVLQNKHKYSERHQSKVTGDPITITHKFEQAKIMKLADEVIDVISSKS